MDRLRRYRKSKTSTTNDQGYQHVGQGKSKSKLPSSSLVAGVMGNDRLECQEPIHRQRESFVEHNLLRTSPVALQGGARMLDCESHTKRFTEQPECKDIFEDKLRKSCPSRDAILELLKKPNPLFLKHLQGVQQSSSRPLCRHLPIPKQSNLEKYEAKDHYMERNTSKNHIIGFKQTHEHGILNRPFTLAGTYNHPRPSKIGGEVEESTKKGTSRIVILKPNHEMAQDARNSLSSYDASRANISGSRKSKGHMSHMKKDEDFVETIEFVDGVEVSASRVKEAKKIGKKVVRELCKITCTMNEAEAKEAAKSFSREVQEVFRRMRTDFPSYVKEIPGTGGLHDFSGINSAIESEIMKMTSYNSTESFISRLAKKRLLERWRRAQMNEHVRAGGKGSRLGEILRISEEKWKNLNAANSRWDSPLGISSADGWRDKYSKIKPRSRSLPPPVTRNAKLYAECEDRTDDKLLLSKEARHGSHSDRVHGVFNEKEDFSSKTFRSSKSISQSRHRRAFNSYALPKNHNSCDGIDLVKKDSKEKHMVPPNPTVTSTIGTGASTTFEYLASSSVSSDVFYPNVSRSILKQCDSSSGGHEHSNPEHLGAEAESSGSLKEADPSPISVLEVPSRDNVLSGPECFEQLSADLHDIQKQISLLSRESKTDYEAPVHIITNFAGIGSGLATDANEIVVSECWESLYIADVLIECGLYDMDTDLFMPSSNGPDHPLGPWVFQNLEKKYCDEISAPRYERMLLFDRICSAVFEISKSCMKLRPWLKPATAEFGLTWKKCKLRDEVHKLLAIQDAEVTEGIPGKVIDKETYWEDLRDSVDMKGIKIEMSLTNDLLMELVMELQLDV